MTDDDLLASLAHARWHIARLDGLRDGLWTRAAAVLSASALAIATSAILISLSSSVLSIALLVATGSLIAVVGSIYHALRVFGVRIGWAKLYPTRSSPPPPFYSAPETVQIYASYEGMSASFDSRTLSDEYSAAKSELWRLSVLHQDRAKGLNRSMHWLLASLALILAAGLTAWLGA